MSVPMRAKLRIVGVRNFGNTEILHFTAVSKNIYDNTGEDEDNTFAKFTPSADLQMTITNETLVGKFSIGNAFYLDFTPIEKD